MNIPYVINIQKYSIHDGDGIRTTVFFKGCALKCWWCHNPESQRYKPELLVNKERCTGCQSCLKMCDKGAISFADNVSVIDYSKCNACGDCIDFCLSNVREVAGQQYEIKDLIKILDKDRQFYEQSGGGVTLSGGEVMSQDIEYLEALCKRIKDRGYNLCIDSCGFAKTDNYLRIAPYVDTFLYDIKVIDDEVHQKYMGQSNELILNNLIAINKVQANINIRIPLVNEVNCSEKAIGDIINFLKDNKINVRNVNLLPYHSTGSSKYMRLNRPYLAENLSRPSDERMNEIMQEFINNGFTDVKIGG
ncbi:MAG: trans-4-hydroxy-L-proline dehydratase activase [Erysipelotrichaceae bacterium]